MCLWVVIFVSVLYFAECTDNAITRDEVLRLLEAKDKELREILAQKDAQISKALARKDEQIHTLSEKLDGIQAACTRHTGFSYKNS